MDEALAKLMAGKVHGEQPSKPEEAGSFDAGVREPASPSPSPPSVADTILGHIDAEKEIRMRNVMARRDGRLHGSSFL